MVLRLGDFDFFRSAPRENRRQLNIVFTQGEIGVAGNGFDELNAPYDAKVVGDYTGLTPP
jgi:hypothetical protein